MRPMRSIALVASAIALALLFACGGSEAPPEETAAAPEPVETAKVEDPVIEPPAEEPEPEPEPEPAAPAPKPKAAPKKPANPMVVMETSKGSITLELYPDKAPITVENFLAYVDQGFYDGTIFHRVIEDFMIQGGGMTTAGDKKPTRDPIQNEARTAGLSNERGTIAMARTFMPHSATAQFFINTRDNNQGTKNLDPTPQTGWGYCVFGKVVEGLDVVDVIAGSNVTMSPQGEPSKPTETLLIKSVKRAS